MSRVLVVEDDPGIRSALIHALSDRGHAVDSAPNAMTGLQAAISGEPDVVILDLGLPDLDGVELLRMLRAVSTTPVIVATARDDDEQVVRALDSGADDYMIKPFSADTLDARIRAVLRRAAADAPSTELVVGGLHLDTRGRTAELDGAALELSPREFDLLAYLMARPGEVVTKRELLAEVWRVSYGGGEKTVDVHLSWLRRKLGETAQEPHYLHTVRGVGVKLVEP
jgi:two-component system, OmpR family, KDP operon response regulator KdpE